MLAMAVNGTVRLAVSDILNRKGISTALFAERANLTYNQALAYRRGVISRIDLETITRICNALEVEPGDLFSYKENSSEA